jgi:ribonuclease HI
MERMVAERLYYMAESKGWFNRQQAGFRKSRGCDDQIARIIQAIEDGFQKKPMQRAVLVLLDFSKAYDTVWRERLLTSMAEHGVPMTYIRWLYRFLENRQARVRFNGSMSSSRTMRQGLPQGSVLSPILFLFYINSLAEILPEMNINSLFADDVSILAVRKTLNEAQDAAQAGIDVVVNWAKGWRLSLNATKSECSFFSNSTKRADTEWKPHIVVDDTVIKFEKTPRLLGVILDRSLTFSAHVKKISKSVGSKLRMLNALTHTDWGWRKEYLMRIYTAFFKSTINYAGFAWQPCLADTHVNALERLQNKALRIVSGHHKTSPVEALYREVGEPSLRTTIRRSAAIAAEKALRLPDDHPRKIAFLDTTPRRLKRQNWRNLAENIHGNLPKGLEQRKPLQYYAFPPWLHTPNLEVHITLPGISGRDDEEDKKIDAAMTRIRALDPDITIYTDGSADAGTVNGGSAMVVTTGEGAHPMIEVVTERKGAEFTCSYEEEVDAMEAAAEWIAKNDAPDTTILVCTDSQSLCMALSNLNPELDNIRDTLSGCESRINNSVDQVTHRSRGMRLRTKRPRTRPN